MKLIDKIKNVFFEEVEDDEEELPQTFAKKVEVPKKKVEPIKRESEHIKEEIVEANKEVEEEIKKDAKEEETNEKEFPMMFDDDDFLEDKNSFAKEEKVDASKTVYKRESHEYNEDKELYQGKKELSYIESVSRPNRSYTKSYYEEKETKGFKPSPIISPIYGILDKNYHKEEVVTKRETKILSTYNKPDLDSVRNKAFGNDDEVVKPKKEFDKTNYEVDNRVYDVNSNKPQVNKVTLADADEYYNDLGLAYNVDYSDASRNAGTRVSKYNPKDKKKNKNNVDDNLFDLIDSMYNKED